MPAKLNTDAVSKIIKELTDGNFILIGDYKGIKSNIQLKHTKCDSVFEVRLDHFKRGQSCRVCEKPKKENIHFISEVEDLVGTEYRFLEPYKDAITKIRVIHDVCGFEYSVKPANFLVGKRCPKCANNIRSDTEEFKREVFNLVGEEYTLSGEYVNNNTKVDIIHNLCGKTISIRPYSFKAGNRCAHCSGKGVIKYDHESFNDLVNELSNNEYEITNAIQYVKLQSKVEFIHKTCGNKYVTVAQYFISGNRCPFCKLNKGELEVLKILDLFQLSYSSQYTFKDCYFKNTLPFDFAIFNTQDQIQCLIEYDGEHHFKPVMHWGGEKAFKLQQKKDKIKDYYCKANNIPLIRIPYWEFKNIDTILTKRLTELGVLSPALVEV
ncbi:DUF2726 domain-containing protein [Paenibacillus taichungensis]